MNKTGLDFFDEEVYELIIKCVYSVFIYAVIAYKTEVRTKESFLGRESSDKAFYRWLKIFETFPEGIALVRNNSVIYANNSLKHILECYDFTGKEDHKNEKLKKALMETNIIPYSTKPEEDMKIVVSNVWQFMIKNEKGATFELESLASRYDQEKPSTTKYITLN